MESKQKQLWFKLYTADFEAADEMSDSELGQIFRAMLNYFADGEITEFQDRFMRQLFRTACAQIDKSIAQYQKTVADNSYKGYCSAMKKSGIQPLSREEWEHNNGQPQLTAVNHSQPQLTEEKKKRKKEDRRIEEKKIETDEFFNSPFC